ncbi:MAG: FAD-dependent oxidoreductase, partial [Synechococcaceae cyanobacterium]|nr:FAD-dependent oxidoreductase [Synechococcaceae cyanobacterium]
VLEQHLLPAGPGARIAPLPSAGGVTGGAIAVGNYANDHHYPGGDRPLQPKSCRWGGRWSGTPFTVPYAALVSASLSNLLVADKCFSVSHMANGATRLQPLILNIGQAAGLAAALCVEHRLAPAELPSDLLQQALIDDPQAPAAPFPLWDTPWHHPHWRSRQHRIRRDPAQLSPEGTLKGGALDPRQAPEEPGERIWQGELEVDGEGGYRLLGTSEAGAQPWPLITLEPALHHWLTQQSTGRAVKLIGCANPWGPWLRVSRLAD